MKPSSLVFAGLLLAALVLLRRRLSKEQIVIGLLVVAWLALRGSGTVHLPDFEETAKKVGPTLGAWTYVLVGAMAYLETAFFLGLIAPGEFSVILGGFVAGQGEINVFTLGVIVALCAVAGDTTSYVLGRRLGRGFLRRHGPRFGVTEKRIHQVERFFETHAGKTILIGRFLGLVRALAPFLAGASRIPARRFIPYDYAAAIVWTVTCVTLGYIFWQSFDTVVRFAKRGTYALGTLVTVIVVGMIAYRWLKEPENRERLGRAWRERSFKALTRSEPR